METRIAPGRACVYRYDGPFARVTPTRPVEMLLPNVSVGAPGNEHDHSVVRFESGERMVVPNATLSEA